MSVSGGGGSTGFAPGTVHVRPVTGPFLQANEVFNLPPSLELPLLAAVAFLASTVALKFASIQFLEYLYFLLIFWWVLRLARAHFVLRTDPPLLRLLLLWLVWCVLALVTTYYSLSRPFYIFLPGLLHQPGWVSVARLAEVLANVAGMIFLGHVFRRDRRKLLFTMRVYFYTAGASGAYSLLVKLGWRLHHALPNATDRANGFYNEGGPYGLYVLTALAVGLFLRPLEARRKLFYLSFFCCLFGLALSASKAAYAGMVLTMALLSLVAATWRQRLASAVAFAAVTFIILTQTPLQQGLQIYQTGSQKYEIDSNLDPGNLNLVGGRVAGLYFVPRMVAAHPWLGVGFAHYGLVRNTPEYRRLAAFVEINDVPGLGILQYLAETGIPITLFLLFVLFVPFALLRRTTHLRRATALGLMQPVAHLMGAQLNLTYPWVVSAFALGLTSWTIRAEEQLEAAADAPTAALLPAAVTLPLPDSHLGGTAGAEAG